MDTILHQVEIHETLRTLRYSPYQQHHSVNSVLLDCTTRAGRVLLGGTNRFNRRSHSNGIQMKYNNSLISL